MKKMTNNKGTGNPKGFTLIELLVVLSILGVLVALAVPRFAGLASDRNIKVCQANLRTMGSAIAVYRIQEDQWPGGISDIATNDPGYIMSIPACPGDGTYGLSADNESATCTIGTHTLPVQS